MACFSALKFKRGIWALIRAPLPRDTGLQEAPLRVLERKFLVATLAWYLIHLEARLKSGGP